MDEKVTPSTPHEDNRKVWKLFVYFALLFLFGQVTGVIFEKLQASGTFEDFAKVTQVITKSLDVVHNRDDAITTIWALLLAALLVFPLGWVYTYTKAKEGYDKSLVQTLIVMAMVVSGFMMMIQDQFSRALALVGVVSAVRFRTNLRDPKDAVYFLLSIAIGMGTGLQVYRVAAWITVVMCIVFLLLHRFQVGENPASESLYVEIKDKKKDKKKKDKTKAEGDAANGAHQNPIFRYLALANALQDKGQGIRRPNAAVVIEAVDSEAAMQFVSETLASHGLQGHLVSVTPRADTTTLEYLLRIDGEDPQLALVAKTIKGQCGTAARDVTAMSLVGAKETHDAATVA